MKLEIKGKYTWKDAYEGHYMEVLCIDGDFFWARNDEGTYITSEIDDDLIPYEEPVKELEWKTFLIELESYNCNKWQVIQRFKSIEEAKQHNQQALSITEIKLNFETVRVRNFTRTHCFTLHEKPNKLKTEI